MERILEQAAMKEVEVSQRESFMEHDELCSTLPLKRTAVLPLDPETLYFLSSDLCATPCWAVSILGSELGFLSFRCSCCGPCTRRMPSLKVSSPRC